ncbi:hypothetical protein A4X03_0g4387 [Tilletia caries]|uniref:Uncharacterized protein n=2 Tax=Tilletia TaxID=13289 RepID=A0A177ULN3_9BASI|nr:hypothetical protein CF335_g4290 [Tilletia laevis]KAE8258405.1 hypothetical protein A4X03_0g4387 [Tilletia caries]
MFYPRLLQTLTFLILTALANSAPLPDSVCPSCPSPPPPSALQARAGPGVPRILQEAAMWKQVYSNYYTAWLDLVNEQKRLGFRHISQLDSLPPAARERFRQILDQTDEAAQGMNRALLEVERLRRMDQVNMHYIMDALNMHIVERPRHG